MVLLPLVVSKVDVPVIAAGGFVDGATMAAALALGAEGVQLGTRMVSSAESPIHDNWKQAVLDAGETDTVFLNQHTSPALRALRTERTNALEFDTETNAMALFGNAMDLYFGGDMEAAVALSGQVAGRIDEIKPVAQIIEECARDCLATIDDLAARYPARDLASRDDESHADRPRHVLRGPALARRPVVGVGLLPAARAVVRCRRRRRARGAHRRAAAVRARLDARRRRCSSCRRSTTRCCAGRPTAR